MEPTEIQEFSKSMKEAGEQGESLTHISLAISVLAVMVAMVTVMGHRTHTEAVLSQARASDTWNQYQAKKIRSDETGIASDQLALQAGADPAATGRKIAEYRGRLERWSEELTELQHKANEFEERVEVAERRAARFDLGEALLQIAVVLCSITLFTRRKLYFLAGLTLGLAGTVVAALGLLTR